MRAPLIVSIVALAVSILAVSADLGRSVVEGDSGSSAALPASGGASVEVLSKLDALSDEMSRLNERLMELEARPVALERAPVMDGFVTREDLALLREELRSAPAMVEPEELQRQIFVALQERLLDQELEKAEVAQGKAAEAREERVSSWSTWLVLDEVQQTQLSEIMRVRDEREAVLLEAWRDGVDPQALEAMREETASDFVSSVRGILSPEQAERMSGKFGDD